MTRRGRKGLLGFAIVAVLPQVALAQFDDWSIEHFRRALDAQRKSELKTAAEEYRLVLTRNPEWAEVYLNLGITYQLQNRYGDAIQSLQKGLAIKPEMTAARVLLGISYYMVQDFQSALKPLEEALKVNPSERQARIYLALSLLGLDRVESAVRHLNQAAQRSPDDVEILYHLAEAYNEGVRQSARLLLQSSRDSALYPWAMGLAAERKSDTNAAIEQYLKALEIDPNLAELYVRLAALFERAGLAELAREASQRYALLRPRMAGPLKVAAGGPEMGVIPEEMYRRTWQRLAPVRPEPGLPSVADGF